MPKLTPSDLQDTFKRLKALYGYAGAWGLKDDPTAFGVEWMKVWRWRYPDELQRAVDIWVGDNKDKWPSPGQLYARMMESAPRRAVTDTVEGPSDWFAFPVTGKDVEGPRYRLQPVEIARRDGLALVEDTTCPEEGCGCRAREVFLTPKSMGVSFRSAVGWALANPRGWKWEHYAMAANLKPVEYA